MTNDELLIDVLRAAGHEDAADLAGKLLAHTKPSEPEPPAAAPTSAEDAARRQGEELLKGIRASATPWISAGSALEGPAPRGGLER